MAEKKKGIRKERLMIITLLVLLVISLSYITYSEFSRYSLQLSQEGFLVGYNQGVRDGVIDTVGKLYSETATCKPVPVVFENVTRYLIDIDCLSEP